MHHSQEFQLTKNSYFCDTEILDCDALIEYVNSLGGVIGEQYKEPQGRIEIVGTAPEVKPEEEKPTVEPTPEVLPDGSIYTVIDGDTLWKIAKSQLGDGKLWTGIYEDNKAEIKNPDLIYAGQALVVNK